MSKLGGLINGQDVTFDTHQSGDNQDINWRNVHLEKRLHRGGGKARFHLFKDASNSSGMNNTEFTQVNREVRRAFKRNPLLKKKLAQEIVKTLSRFSSDTATIADAKLAAQNLAKYFTLGKQFLNAVDHEAEGRLLSLTTVHLNKAKGTKHEIIQSADKVKIRQVFPTIFTEKLPEE
ncbi:hypothetical protein [Prosthecobacter sp.]|jgi:hypothetical protein|uniref:hypothetical protein n=1 Tax=Prosthecobacter sp. TaxID=1965333 RepID=UPI0037C88CAE